MSYNYTPTLPDKLTKPENALIKATANGEECKLGDGTRPSENSTDPTRIIRTEVIRFLALGGDDKNTVDPRGIRLFGAYIPDQLDLANATIPIDLFLVYCFFEQEPILRSASCQTISFEGNQVPGIGGDRLKTTGSLFLRNNFKSTGEVRLLGAEIGGNLDCQNATFNNPNGYALSCDSIKVKGDIFLIDKFTANGEFRLVGAEIGGDICCENATFSNLNGNALALEKVKVEGSFILRGKTLIEGELNLTGASVSSLVDEKSAWPQKGKLSLDGFTYESIGGSTTPTDAKSRLEWLNLQSDNHLVYDFRPQPYEQLAKTLRQMGHTNDTRLVKIAKIEALHNAENKCFERDWGICKATHIAERDKHQTNYLQSHKKTTPSTLIFTPTDRYNSLTSRFFRNAKYRLNQGVRHFLFSASQSLKYLKHGVEQTWNWLFKNIIAFGYEPWRVIYILVFFWLFGSATFYVANENNIMVPSDSRIYTLTDDQGIKEPIPSEYPKFNPFTYSLDTLIPLVGLHQEKYWEPNAGTDWWLTSPSWWVRFYLWFQIVMGWMLATLGVAGMTGIVKRD